MRLNHNKVLLAERFHCYIRVYYADGHYELRDENIQDYIKQNRGKSGYKHPILIENQNLYPTIDQRKIFVVGLILDILKKKIHFIYGFYNHEVYMTKQLKCMLILN